MIAQHKSSRYRMRPIFRISLPMACGWQWSSLQEWEATFENHAPHAAISDVPQAWYLQQIPPLCATHDDDPGGARPGRTQRRDTDHRRRGRATEYRRDRC